MAWFFGAGWVALTTGGAVFYRFAGDMGVKNYAVAWGLLSAVPFVATFFQIIGSLISERTGRNKVLFMVCQLAARASWVLVGLLPLVILPNTLVAVAWVLLLFLLVQVGANLAGPPWLTWMADVIPGRIRGRYFGIRHRVAMTMFVAMALVAGWMLNAANSPDHLIRFPWPSGLFDWHLAAAPFPLKPLQVCSLLFAVGGILGVADILCFVRMREVPRTPPANPPTLRQLLATPLRDRQFVRFLAFYGLLTIGSPATYWYIWNHVTTYLGVSDLTAQFMMVIIPTIGELMFAPVWGRLIDRVGRKTVMRIALAFPVILPICWLGVLPEYWWLGFIIPFLGNISWLGSDQCNINLTLHLASGETGSSSYQALYALTVAIAGTLSGLVLGGLAWISSGVHVDAGPFHFDYLLVVFTASTAIRAVAYLWLLPRVDDDGRQAAGI